MIISFETSHHFWGDTLYISKQSLTIMTNESDNNLVFMLLVFKQKCKCDMVEDCGIVANQWESLTAWWNVVNLTLDEISKHDFGDVTNVDDITNVMFYLPWLYKQVIHGSGAQGSMVSTSWVYFITVTSGTWSPHTRLILTDRSRMLRILKHFKLASYIIRNYKTRIMLSG